MRVKNSINNITYNMIFYFINSSLSFVSRTALIHYIGGDFVGLSSVFTNILGYLNVVELGIGQAVTYSLYKPLKEKNYERINILLSLYRRIYHSIGIFIGIGSFIIGLFIDKLVHTQVIPLWQVRIYFYMYAIITISSYFLTYIQILVMAEQKEYIITKVTGYFYTVKIITQVLSNLLLQNYAAWIIIELLFSILTNVYINKKVFKEHEWINLNSDRKLIDLIRENKQIFIDTKDLLYHKIAGVIVFQTDSLVISAFTNLKKVAIYGNYIMIESIVKSIVGTVFGGVRASVGDLIAEGDNERSYLMWRDMYIFSSLIGTILVFCFFININDFMNLWVGKTYVLDNLALIVLSVNLFIYITRTATVTFNFGYGLFWDKWAAIIEAIVNLVISLILVKDLGIAGVLIGTFMSNILIVVCWKPYMLFKYGFNKKIGVYIKKLLKVTTITIVSVAISSTIVKFIYMPLDSLLISLLLKCIISFISISSSYVLLSSIDRMHRDFYFKYLNLFKCIINKKYCVNK